MYSRGIIMIINHATMMFGDSFYHFYVGFTVAISVWGWFPVVSWAKMKSLLAGWFGVEGTTGVSAAGEWGWISPTAF